MRHTITEQNTGRSTKVGVGDEIEIQISEDSSTGLNWDIKTDLAVVSNDLQSGIRIFQLGADVLGEHQIQLSLNSHTPTSWPSDAAPPVEEYKLLIEVDDEITNLFSHEIRKLFTFKRITLIHAAGGQELASIVHHPDATFHAIVKKGNPEGTITTIIRIGYLDFDKVSDVIMDTIGEPVVAHVATGNSTQLAKLLRRIMAVKNYTE